LWHNGHMRLLLLCVALALLPACNDSAGAPDVRPSDLYTGEGLRFPDGAIPEGGLPDGGLTPDTFVDPNDWDGDGVSNDVEQQYGLDPKAKDTDNDGTDDATELGDPSSPKDSDGDGKIDAKEPSDFDSDMDGIPDSQDSDDTDGKCGQVKRLFLNDTLTQDTTLGKTCSPYKVLGTLGVVNGATLTVAGDVTVRLGPNAALFLGDNATLGGLNLAGTKSTLTDVVHPVTLTADTSQPAKGFWRGVVAENGALVVLSYATLEYGGGPTGGADPKALLLVKAANGITLNESTLHHAAGYGLHATLKNTGGKLFLGFQNNTFGDLDHAAALNIRHLGELESGNDFGTAGAGGEVQVSEGIVDQPATWRSTGVPYVFVEPSINIDADLQINAGVKLVLAANSAINVAYSGSGRISAQGSSSSPVRFTTQNGAAGSWQGILLHGGNNNLQNTQIVGAGASSSSGVSAALYLSVYANLSLNNISIMQSAADGAYFQRSGSDCSQVKQEELTFSGVTGCGLYCVDDYNTPGQCLSTAP